MAKNRRHQEFFGPDLLRAPVLSGSPPVAAVQIASAIAQLRAPLLRDDAAVEEHADFIRSLADRLFPDFAAQIRMDVGAEAGDAIDTTIRVESGHYGLLQCWLADASGGGVTGTAPDAVSWSGGTVVQTITANTHYQILTPLNNVVTARVSYTGVGDWYWAVWQFGRVFYSTKLSFA